jgi:hypothetical protein
MLTTLIELKWFVTKISAFEVASANMKPLDFLYPCQRSDFIRSESKLIKYSICGVFPSCQHLNLQRDYWQIEAICFQNAYQKKISNTV